MPMPSPQCLLHRLAGMLAVFGPPCLGAADGLVPNAGFEEGSDGNARSWMIQARPLTAQAVAGKGSAVIDWTDGSRGDGARCLRIRGSGSTGDDFAIVVSPHIRVEPGFAYTAGVWYRASGLAPENGDRSRAAQAFLDVFQHDATSRFLGNTRAITSVNTPEWAPLATAPFTIPEGVTTVQLRIQLANTVPGGAVEARFDDAWLLPADAGVPNPGIESLDAGGQPVAWRSQGTGRCTVDAGVRHNGASCLAVADAGDGVMSGWTTVMPVRPDRSYRLNAWAKGGKLAANGFLPGGAVQIEFLDNEDRVLGKPAVSPTVGPDQDWTELVTPAVQPPPGAARMRLTAGLRYCNGTAWFDDFRLEATPAAVVGQVLVKRNPAADPGVRYAVNLLANPGIEEGEGDKPAHWTFVGSSNPDWSAEAIATFHREGRPRFDLGRARPGWSRDQAYAGNGALLLESIDPPLSKNQQWYGRNPVDGCWLSDPMPCTAGQDYLAAAWINPGASISGSWFGPLELRFYDAVGRQLNANAPRSGIGGAPAGVWSWWSTRPYRAPAGATLMRLRVGQELAADSGGWGRARYDNLAVWNLPAGAPEPPAISGDGATHRAWVGGLLSSSPPPYLAAPAAAAPYESCWIQLANAVPGNCFRDPAAPVRLRVDLRNILGEAREVRIRATCTDWKGAAQPAVLLPAVAVGGFAAASTDLDLPAPGAYGTYHVELEALEGEAVVGLGSGRFGELPALDRPRTSPPIWGVTPLIDGLVGDGRPFERELGEMFRTAGFGITWVRVYSNEMKIDQPATIGAAVEKLRPQMQWFRSLGIRPVLQIGVPWTRPIVRANYVAAGRAIASASKDLVLAYGNHGIEQANSASPYRGGGKERLTDQEYDTILAGLSEGLKSEAPGIPVLVGNIATDWEGKTLNRIYASCGKDAFDGAILNAYLGVTMTVLNNLKVFDAHGDAAKGIWQEETALQRSPIGGEARRYGEGEGAANLVRGWLEPVIKAGPRLKAFTMWGFRQRGGASSDVEDDIAMVNEHLQPRPQFAAHAVMADALADATFVADRSRGQLTCGEWTRGDGRLLALWSNAGSQAVTLEAPRGVLTVMDVMGNRREVHAMDGVAVLTVGTEPVYCFAGGDLGFSSRIEVALAHGTVRADRPSVRLSIRNNQDAPAVVRIAMTGPLAAAPPPELTVPAHGRRDLDVPVRSDLDQGRRTPFSVTATTLSGAVFAADAALNIACAVRAEAPVPLDGTWTGPWAAAPRIRFGSGPGEVTPPSVPGDTHTGPDDIAGTIRLLWDDRCLYLGVQAEDDIHFPQTERNGWGFMGDSIEFAIQPDGILSNLAPRYEYELYRPKDDPVPALNRRFPADRAGGVPGWGAAVVQTGHRGDVNYQLAIPWAEIGVTGAPAVGRALTLGVVLNDADTPKVLGGGRGRILWFRGVDTKNTEGFGDVVLVGPNGP